MISKNIRYIFLEYWQVTKCVNEYIITIIYKQWVLNVMPDNVSELELCCLAVNLELAFEVPVLQISLFLSFHNAVLLVSQTLIDEEWIPKQNKFYEQGFKTKLEGIQFTDKSLYSYFTFRSSILNMSRIIHNTLKKTHNCRVRGIIITVWVWYSLYMYRWYTVKWSVTILWTRFLYVNNEYWQQTTLISM